ncbi:Rv1733c family protein [Mycobacterium sp. SMC-4]|uniref:Rv1733c family protein n=1 Tax=Mycobacterium sp. SMC-4 TaxID=2857059 RepID=UPI003CFC0896
MRSHGARDQHAAARQPRETAEVTTFELGWPRWPAVVRLRGRDPLVRRIDRIEAVVMTVIVALALCALPVIGAIGTAVYDARQDRYAQETDTVSQIEATVTAAPERTTLPPRTSVVTVPVAWTVGGYEHSGEVQVSSATAPGDVVPVWVDENGEQTKAPGSTPHAAVEGVTIAAVLIGLTLAVAVAASVATRLVCNRLRFARWDHGLRSLDTAGK